MTVKEIYCYEREVGKTTVSTEKPECDYIIKYRLIADEYKLLTKDSEKFTTCVDVESVEDWYEIDESEKDKSPSFDEISPSEFMTLIEEAL